MLSLGSGQVLRRILPVTAQKQQLVPGNHGHQHPLGARILYPVKDVDPNIVPKTKPDRNNGPLLRTRRQQQKQREEQRHYPPMRHSFSHSLVFITRHSFVGVAEKRVLNRHFALLSFCWNAQGEYQVPGFVAGIRPLDRASVLTFSGSHAAANKLKTASSTTTISLLALSSPRA